MATMLSPGAGMAGAILLAPTHHALDVESQRLEQREPRRQLALTFLLPLEEIAHRPGTLVVPLVGHLAVGTLLVEHLHDVLAVDDLGVMVHADHARHRPAGVAGELDHRHGAVSG